MVIGGIGDIILSCFIRFLSWQQTKQAQRQGEAAQKERKLAKDAATLANQSLKRIRENVNLRRLIFSQDRTAFNEALKTTPVDTQIRFEATAKEYPYKAIGGEPTFKFQIFPVEQSVPGGFKSIALITYIMDHPTFLNSFISTGPDKKFTGTYDGVGCLKKVIAVIEYSNVDKPIAIAQFNMCDLLGW